MKLRRSQIISLIAIALTIGGFIIAPQGTHAQTTSNTPFQLTTPPPTEYNNATTQGTQLGQQLQNSNTQLQTIQNNFSSELNNIELNNNGGTANAIPSTASPATKPSIDPEECGIIFSGTLTGCINLGLTYLINNIVLPVANWFLTLMGVLLNGVMILTLNMSSLVNASGGIIDAAWSTIRDISSIVIIFFLLYASINIILGREKSSVQHIIVMVVIAGILINFSLFFTKIAIDASNLVSLAFYRAIAPSGANVDFSSNYTGNAYTSGGISNEFMDALKIQTLYNAVGQTVTASSTNSQVAATGNATSPPNTSTLAIIVSGIGGVTIMVVAGLSFFFAAVLFAIRIALLIILMAFSPVYFVGLIVPKIKDKLSDRWSGMLINQCLIMPIYMLFMYIALRVITNSSFQSALNPQTTPQGTALFSLGLVGTIMEYIIGLILIIIPMVAALEYANVGKDWVKAGIKSSKKWAGSAVKGTAGFAGRNTAGRVANVISENEKVRKFVASTPLVGDLADRGLKGISSASFGGRKGGYDKARKDDEKTRKDRYNRLGEVHRENYATEDDYKKAQQRALGIQGSYINRLKGDSLSKIMGLKAERNAYKLEKDYNATYGRVNKDEIEAAGKFETGHLEQAKQEKQTAQDIRRTEIGQYRSVINRQESQIKESHSSSMVANDERLKNELEKIEAKKKKNIEQTNQINTSFTNIKGENAKQMEQLQAEMISVATLAGQNDPVKTARRAELQKSIEALKAEGVKTDSHHQEMLGHLKGETENLERDAARIKEQHTHNKAQLDEKLNNELKDFNNEVKPKAEAAIKKIETQGMHTDVKYDAIIEQREEMNRKNAEERAKFSKAAQQAADRLAIKNAVKEVNDESDEPKKDSDADKDKNKP